MKRTLLVPCFLSALMLAMVTAAYGQSDITGTWVTHNFAEPNLIDLRANGTRVTGTISRNHEVRHITDGGIAGTTITFKVIVAGGDRTISFTGQLNGGEIAFTRSAQVRGAAADGGGIFGGRGVMEFVATRDNAAGVAVPRALFGNWKHNLERSTYDPGPAPRPTVSEVLNFVSRPAGKFGIGTASVSVDGVLQFNLAVLKADGRDYPVYYRNDLAAFLDMGPPSTLTKAFRAVNDRTFEMTYKTNGIVTQTLRLTVSEDGKTLTDTGSFVDAQGQTISTYTELFDRVDPSPTPPT